MEFRVTRVRRIFSDGRHNAFTGIASFRGKVFITFRNGKRHQSPDGKIMVISSADLDTWSVVCERPHPELDLRDPKIVAFRDRLFVYCDSGSKEKGPQSWVFVSEDGEHFGPERLVGGEAGQRVLWWLAPRGETLYGTAYVEGPSREVTSLFASEDGLSFRLAADFPVPSGNEVSIDFDADGRLWALARAERFGYVPTLTVSRPPYIEFDSVRQLPFRLQGPMLKRLDGGCAIVCRRWEEPMYTNARTDLLWLPDGRDPQFVRTLPSGGDTSYAGWLDVAPGRALISYYASHAFKMDQPFDPARHQQNWWGDIYLAEVEYR